MNKNDAISLLLRAERKVRGGIIAVAGEPVCWKQGFPLMLMLYVRCFVTPSSFQEANDEERRV